MQPNCGWGEHHHDSACVAASLLLQDLAVGTPELPSFRSSQAGLEPVHVLQLQLHRVSCLLGAGWRSGPAPPTMAPVSVPGCSCRIWLSGPQNSLRSTCAGWHPEHVAPPQLHRAGSPGAGSDSCSSHGDLQPYSLVPQLPACARWQSVLRDLRKQACCASEPGRRSGSTPPTMAAVGLGLGGCGPGPGWVWGLGEVI